MTFNFQSHNPKSSKLSSAHYRSVQINATTFQQRKANSFCCFIHEPKHSKITCSLFHLFVCFHYFQFCSLFLLSPYSINQFNKPKPKPNKKKIPKIEKLSRNVWAQNSNRPISHVSNGLKSQDNCPVRIPSPVLQPGERRIPIRPICAPGNNRRERRIRQKRVNGPTNTIRVVITRIISEGSPLRCLVDGARFQHQPTLGTHGVPRRVIEHHLGVLLAVRTVRIRHHFSIWKEVSETNGYRKPGNDWNWVDGEMDESRFEVRILRSLGLLPFSLRNLAGSREKQEKRRKGERGYI